MNLYFLDADGKETLVSGPYSQMVANDAMQRAMDDLKTRRPEHKIHYQRCWWDDHGRFWIDFGSHTEFYIVK